MHNLLLTGAFAYSEKQLRQICDLGYNVSFLQYENEELPVPAEDIECTVCNGLFLHHDIEKFTNLKFIQLTSAGLDRVPTDNILHRGIILHNARGVYNIPMAEWVFFRVLQHYKQAAHFQYIQDSHQWIKNRDLREICGRNIAIIGAGNIGQTIAKRFAAFDAHITGFDIHENPIPFFDEIRTTKTLRNCISDFDIVILTAPLTAETYHMISADMLQKMKSNAMLINISRGGLIDECSLCDILQERQDLYAVLDVFETEPLPSGSRLWGLDNVALSPHNSFVSDGNAERLFNVIYNNLKNFAESIL